MIFMFFLFFVLNLYYTLYSESPFYFFNYNVRDQIKTVNYTLADQNGFSANHGYAFDYRYIADTQMEKSVCNVKNLFLQSGKGNYFYNFDTAQRGRDFVRKVRLVGRGRSFTGKG